MHGMTWTPCSKSDGNAARSRGFTLIELLVVLAICAVLFGLLLGAIQNARLAALRAKDRNNCRQIILAAHSYNADFGALPDLSGPVPGSYTPSTLFIELLPYLELGGVRRAWLSPNFQDQLAVKDFRIKIYVSPLDGSSFSETFQSHACSYAANARVFAAKQTRLNSVTDGTSNTIFFAEHYATCGSASFIYSCPVAPPWESATTTWQLPMFAFGNDPPYQGARTDYFPVTSGNPPVSRAMDGVTFQVRPQIGDCDPRQANTGDPSGMPCMFGDGSVRTMSKSVAPEVFWGAVTPNRGEVLSDF